MYIMILAGGQGRRLSPLSTLENPKQFLTFSLGESLLQKTVRRFVEYGLGSSTYVVTTREYVSRTIDELTGFNQEFEKRVIIEPYSRNTAPAISWAIRSLLQNQLLKLDDIVMTVPIDHFVSDDKKFTEILLKGALNVCLEEILSFGIFCKKPVESYGYIKKGKQVNPCKYQVDNFIEKPSQAYAKELMKEGCLWNLGIYVFHAKTYLQALVEQQPVLYKMSTDILNGSNLYENIKPISIDHAVIARAQDLKVYEVEGIEWFDIGTWDGLNDFFHQNQKNSVDEPCAQMFPVY